MEKRKPSPGDHFLLPFTGKQRDLLIQAVRPGPLDHWTCRYPARPEAGETTVLLSSCHRVSPARAARILGLSADQQEQSRGGEHGR